MEHDPSRANGLISVQHIPQELATRLLSGQANLSNLALQPGNAANHPFVFLDNKPDTVDPDVAELMLTSDAFLGKTTVDCLAIVISLAQHFHAKALHFYTR